MEPESLHIQREAGVEIIVAPPGRFIDHMGKRRVDLSGLQMLILDEADRLEQELGISLDFISYPQQSPEGREMRKWIVENVQPIVKKRLFH